MFGMWEEDAVYEIRYVKSFTQVGYVISSDVHTIEASGNQALLPEGSTDVI